jgi:hypothetical protein
MELVQRRLKLAALLLSRLDGGVENTFADR